MQPKAILCWSGGKDSALCLHRVLEEGIYEISYLLTTINETFGRVSMHGVRECLVEQQADAIGIPLLKVFVKEGNNEEYERNMEALLVQAKAEGIDHVIFGDIFLEDLRVYREENLSKIEMKAIFPLWKQDTRSLIDQFLSLQFRTVLCCVNDGFLSSEFAGKEISKAFINGLPPEVDPCGENGEYHTFCFAGPIFKNSIPFTIGETVYKALHLKTSDDSPNGSPNQTQGFWYCDLLPAGAIH